MIEYRTYVVPIDADGEDRFPYGFDPSGDPISKTQTDGTFDFPLDFEFTTSNIFGAYKGLPNYLRVDSDGRRQYYFLKPIAVAYPRYLNGVAVQKPYKFAAHKDVCASFNVEDIQFRMSSRIYQGHFLGGYSFFGRQNVYAPDWTATPRYMPYHYDEIKTVYSLFNNQQYTVIVYFTRKTTGIKGCFITYEPINYLWGSNERSVGDFIFGLKQVTSFGNDVEVDSIDDVRVVPYQIVENSTLFQSAVVGDLSGPVINGNDYLGIILNDSLYGTLSIFSVATDTTKVTTPYQNNTAFEIGAGSSWIRIPPRVFASAVPSDRPCVSVGFQLYVGAGGTFQLIMEVYTPFSLQSIDLSQYCNITFYWLNGGDKAAQTTAAALQLVAGVLGTAASVALAVPTGGVSLIGAASGVASTAGGIVGTIDAIEKPPQTTSGAGSFPGSFVTRSPDTLAPVLGFPVVRVYTVSYSDSVAGEMRGAYTENPAGEPFALSIKQQWKLFETRSIDGGTKFYPNYMYIRADAVPYIDRNNYITAYMTDDDVSEFVELLRRGLRLWLGNYQGLYEPATERNFWQYAEG